MFKSRSGSQGNASPPPPQSIEAVRRRARHRLIGASVLVLLGVIGFPLLFDTQPRPIAVDIPIEIPAKNTPAPVAKPAATASAPAAKPAAAPSAPLTVREGLGASEEVVEAAPKPTPAPAAAAPTPVPAPAPVAAAPATVKPAAPAPAEADRARALLEGKPPASAVAKPAAASTERIVVQVGAFSEAAGARAVRQKLESAGLKTYVHEAQTPDGKRIRVRVGPFENRADAEKAAARVKALGLPAAVLTL